MKSKQMPIAFCVIALSVSLAWSQGTYVIRNAKIITVSGPILPEGSVVVKDGTILDVGTRVSVPAGAKVIDARGLTVYPGLFDSDTRVGLTEIGAVRETSDYSELGEYMPHLLAFNAIHVESEHIPVTRASGITHVLSRPNAGTIPGQAAVVSLDGWSPYDMEIKRNGAMVLEFPSLLQAAGGSWGGVSGSRRGYPEIKKEYEQKIRELKDLLAKARHYMRALEKWNPEENSVSIFYPNKQLEALVPVVKGEQPVLIQANSHVDIRNAVHFAREEKLNFVLLGANDAWRVVDFLKENNVRVILGPRQALPSREDDPIDIIYRTPAILHEKGVSFALATANSAHSRTLPYEVGNAVAYGLPYETALRSITLTPAEFLGVADQVGSVEKGKKANLVVATGDILEYQTEIKHLFINGQPVSQETKHTRLYDKYRKRP